MKFVSEEREYTYLIGQGLSVFGRMEMALAELFSQAVQTTDPKVADRVFWAVNSLEVRTAMTGAAVKCALSVVEEAEMEGEWNEIVRTIPKYARRRAELAHGNWIGLAWTDKRGRFKVDQFFAPYWGKASLELDYSEGAPDESKRPKRRLYKPDLEATIKDFSSLELTIRHFRARLRYWQLRASGKLPKQSPGRGRKAVRGEIQNP